MSIDKVKVFKVVMNVGGSILRAVQMAKIEQNTMNNAKTIEVLTNHVVNISSDYGQLRGDVVTANEKISRLEGIIREMQSDTTPDVETPVVETPAEPELITETIDDGIQPQRWPSEQ